MSGWTSIILLSNANSNLEIICGLSSVIALISPKARSPSPGPTSMIESGKISSCLAVEDVAAIHYKDNKLLTSVSFYKNKKSYIVKKTESGIIEEEIGGIQL